jgi:ribulose-phosphate 3-epimerase
MSSQLAKVSRLRQMIDRAGLDILVEVDGGVTAKTAPLCLAAGAHALVAGTAVFKGGSSRYAANIADLKAGQVVSV